MTVHGHVAEARRRLVRAGIAPTEAELDARLLAQWLLDWDAARFFASADREAPAGFPERYAALVGRRAAREPLAYVTGRRDFWDLTFEVSPAVLVPRPETELLIEAALGLFPDREADLSAADVCTGSGCLAVTLAHERPRASIAATDISAEALLVAGRNAARHGVADRVRFVRADLLEDSAEKYDLIVCNPPYVPESDRERLPPEVRGFEPPLALFAGADGLDVIRRLLARAPGRLVHGGSLMLEVGYGQAPDVGRLIAGTPGLTMAETRQDLQGIPRVLIAARV